MTDAPLPGVLAEIEELAGRDAALALCRALGGTSLYVPGPMYIHASHRLVRGVGTDSALKIAERFHGETIDIPLARQALVKDLAARGLKPEDIASELRLSVKTVRRYRK